MEWSIGISGRLLDNWNEFVREEYRMRLYAFHILNFTVIHALELWAMIASKLLLR